MKVCLDLHDFSVIYPRIDLLMELKRLFPRFKVSLFTIPFDESSDWGPALIKEDFLEILRSWDWVEFIPHGVRHEGSEMLGRNYRRFRYVDLPFIREYFDRNKLRYVEGFCAPHWRWNDSVVKVLDDEGWWGAVDRDKNMPCPKRYYRYNCLLNEEFPSVDVLKLHGHLHGTKNDLGRCFGNLLRLPESTEWLLATELLENK